MSTQPGRTYSDAIALLNTLQSNAATIEALRKSGGRLNDFAIPEMKEYLARIGYTPSDLNALNVIHITGTKGKGSTAAFCEALLRSLAPGAKVGLYTSPHLVAVRERIRIGGKPIPEEMFARYFFEVWERLERNMERANPLTPEKPVYFRYLTLMAFHTFLSEKVDATILEVGIGGTYDSTNIVPRPIVTGVTTLGLDHVSMLGNTIGEIARNKGGIYKEDVPALSVEQIDDGEAVLRERAAEAKASSFSLVPVHPSLPSLPLGLKGTHQHSNASLALSLASTFLHSSPPPRSSPDLYPPSPSPTPTLSPDRPIPAAFLAGLEKASWPGRCQTVVDPTKGGRTWFLDGAHTTESLEACVRWFAALGVGLRANSSPTRILIFNCTSGRSAQTMLSTLLSTLSAQLGLEKAAQAGAFFDHVVFCTNVTYASGGFKGDLASLNTAPSELSSLAVQRDLASAWGALGGRGEVHVLPSIEHAVRVVESASEGEVDVLVTGSLHLVGGVVEVAGLGEVALGS